MGAFLRCTFALLFCVYGCKFTANIRNKQQKKQKKISTFETFLQLTIFQ